MSLTLNKSDFYSKVGNYLGYGFGPDKGDKAWTDRQLLVIKDCVDSGLRLFYRPPPASGFEGMEWSFLQPVGSIVVADDSSVALLPEDFGGFTSRLRVTNDDAIFAPVPVVNEAQVAELHIQTSDNSGFPMYAAVRPLKATTAGQPPRKELVIYPTADQDYTFKFQYKLMPHCLDDNYPYAYGGSEHSETILAACLRIAEERYDNIQGGPLAARFFEQLAASISHERSLRPHLIGYNADHSDALEGGRRWTADYWQPVTYLGVPMGDY